MVSGAAAPAGFLEQPPQLLPEAEVKALLKACDGPGSLERRDRALILAYLDTGNRLSEIGNLRLLGDDDAGSDVDLDGGVLGVLGKGGRVYPARGQEALRVQPSYGSWSSRVAAIDRPPSEKRESERR